MIIKLDREYQKNCKVSNTRGLDYNNDLSENSSKIEDNYISPTYSNQELIRRSRLFLGDHVDNIYYKGNCLYKIKLLLHNS